ncbi:MULTISPECIES: SDR family NAD(P)-dependent oxidoreductase [Streptomyces]|uniref:SDR family NAD(P)-dependent oxidoreductase n=1 Tax=Streptomyces TaxID=1883 RepID=UPI002FDC47D6
MSSHRVALVTGASQGLGFQVAKELVAAGHTVFVGSRSLERGEAGAAELGPAAVAVQLDVTDRSSVDAVAERIRSEFGHLDLLVNNAGISNTSGHQVGTPEYFATAMASNASLDEIRAVFETNVFGALAVYQALLPLLRESSDARVVNVSSLAGSLATNSDPSFPHRGGFGPIYTASKTAMNAMGLAMMIELESTRIKVNQVSPGFAATRLNGFAGTESVEDGAREIVRVALLGPDAPGGTFTQWENVEIPW